MSAKFLEGLGGKLAEQWVATLFTPAFVFWLGGALAYVTRYGWEPISKLFPDAKLEALQIAVLAGISILIYISALIIQRFDVEILRGLEGYWYPGLRKLLRPLHDYMTQRQVDRWKKLKERRQPLSKSYRENPSSLSRQERAELVRCDRALRQFPTDETDFLPTRLGNLLRAAERRPYDRYGLDAIICWPRLWLLLPDSAKKELQDARAQINNGVRVFAWSLLFLVWGYWAWWAVPVAIVSAAFAYSWIWDSAELYGDLIESVFDLYRGSLYQALRIPLPATAAEEKAIGLQITEYLLRGTGQLEFLPSQNTNHP
ncbi:hypothetical protein ACN4EG_06705 [Alkalinema pantanalense CENA528]|uniref:hypothetical protein n=1 Tax=Alkalinema pantanalense TaxID=1620705 RepID=UPI003D6F63EB